MIPVLQSQVQQKENEELFADGVRLIEDWDNQEPNPDLVKKLAELIKGHLLKEQKAGGNQETESDDPATEMDQLIAQLDSGQQEPDQETDQKTELPTAQEVLSNKALMLFDTKAAKPQQDGPTAAGPCKPGQRADMTGCTPKLGPPKRGFPKRTLREAPNLVHSKEKKKLVAHAHKLAKEMYSQLKAGKTPTKAQFKEVSENLKHLNWATLRSLHAKMLTDEQVAKKKHRVKALLDYAHKMSGDKPKATKKPSTALKPKPVKKPSPKKADAIRKQLKQVKDLPPEVKSKAAKLVSWLGRVTKMVGSDLVSGTKLTVGALIKTMQLLKGSGKKKGKGKGKKPSKGKPGKGKDKKPKLTTKPKPTLKIPPAIQKDVDDMIDKTGDAMGKKPSPKERGEISLNLIAWLLSLLGIEEKKHG